jgi:drug/metabolite transporter (DMT)-like permease
MSIEERKGVIAGLLAVSCWAGFILVSRVGGQSSLGALDVMALRFLVGGLLLLPFVRGRLWLNWRGLSLALVGGIGYCLMVYQGFRYTSAVHASVMLPGLIPFGAALFSYFILAERPVRVRLAGLCLIALGGVLMLSSIGGAGSVIGDLWLFGAVLAWALYTVLARRWKVPPMTGAVTTGVGSAILFLPIYFLFLPVKLAQAAWVDIAMQGFYQGVIATVVAMLLYLRAVASIGPSAMGALMALVPVLSGFAAVPLLGESLAPQEMMALALTSLGAWLASGLFFRRRAVPQRSDLHADG